MPISSAVTSRAAATNGARSLTTCVASRQRSISLFWRIFFRNTGVQFSGKCSTARFPIATALSALVAFAAVLLAPPGDPPLLAQGVPARPESEATEVRPRVYRSMIRFVTDSDYPPFNYLDDDGTLTGFNVDMARAVCLELDVSCDVQARDWTELVPALKRGDTDAIIASLAINPNSLKDLDFSDRYYFMSARFAVLKGALSRTEISPAGLESKRVAVVKGTAHEAYLSTFFRDCVLIAFDTADQARDAVREGKAELLFDDGVALGFWVNGTNAKACCELRGGAFNEPRFFGDGVGIAVRKGDQELKRVINVAIKRVRESGQFDEIVKRYFPHRTD